MYAVFAAIDDPQFDDVSPKGQMTVHLFDTEQDALGWAIDLLIDKGDLMIHDFTYILTDEWEKDGRFCRHFTDKEDALIAWQETLSTLNFFHLGEVKDHRELGG